MQRLENKVDKLAEAFQTFTQEVTTFMATQKVRCDNCEKDLKEHDMILRGKNGDCGKDSMVRRLQIVEYKHHVIWLSVGYCLAKIGPVASQVMEKIAKFI